MRKSLYALLAIMILVTCFNIEVFAAQKGLYTEVPVTSAESDELIPPAFQSLGVFNVNGGYYSTLRSLNNIFGYIRGSSRKYFGLIMEGQTADYNTISEGQRDFSSMMATSDTLELHNIATGKVLPAIKSGQNHEGTLKKSKVMVFSVEKELDSFVSDRGFVYFNIADVMEETNYKVSYDTNANGIIISNSTKTVILPVSGPSAGYKPQIPEVKVIINGSELKFASPIITKGGRTFYPVRQIFLAMGVYVSWDPYTMTASGTKDGNTVEFTIDSKVYKVNGESKDMDAPAFINNGSTYIPIRYAAEGFGYTVEWDEATKTITIQ